MAGQTIPHRIQVKFKSAKLLLMPACPGTGIIAGGPLRKIVELAGIKDLLSKSLGSKNRVASSQAAIKALSELTELPWLKKETPKAEQTEQKDEKEKIGTDVKKAMKKEHAAATAEAPKEAQKKVKVEAKNEVKKEEEPKEETPKEESKS